jgi:hypothetical protein
MYWRRAASNRLNGRRPCYREKANTTGYSFSSNCTSVSKESRAVSNGSNWPEAGPTLHRQCRAPSIGSIRQKSDPLPPPSGMPPRSSPSAKGPWASAPRSGRQYLVESNRSSVSTDDRAICNLPVGQHSQPRYAMRPGALRSLLRQSATSSAIGYLLSALANR